MERIPIGQFIRERRKAKGITQEELCDNICDVTTLSRIENGKDLPRNATLHNLLEKLGLPDAYYTVPTTEYEETITALRQEVRSKTIAFEKATGAERVAQREETLKALAKLEEQTEVDDLLTRQRIVRDRVVLGTPEGPYSPAEQRELLLEALKLTAPHFDPEQINSFWYTQEETGLINQIAITYTLEGNREKAIDIYQQLFYYIQNHNQQLSRYAGQLTMVAYNLSRELNSAGRYEEAIQVAEAGRKTCVKYGNYELLPQLLAILANCHAHLEHKKESEEFYWQAYYLYKAFEDFENLAHLKNDAYDTLGLKLP